MVIVSEVVLVLDGLVGCEDLVQSLFFFQEVDSVLLVDMMMARIVIWRVFEILVGAGRSADCVEDVVAEGGNFVVVCGEVI